jgi:ATP-dependent helicase HrpA
MAARVRRVELVDDEMLFDFFDGRVDADVTDTRRFDRWWKAERQRDGRLLDLTDEMLADREHGAGIRLEDFPDVWLHGDIELPLTYRYAPGEPLDGVTAHIPLNAINQIEPAGFAWQIAGHRPEIVAALVRSVQKDVRRQLGPMAEMVEGTIERVRQFEAGSIPFLHAVSVFNPAVLDDYLKMNFVISTEVDGSTDVVDVGVDLAAIKARQVGASRQSIAAAAPIEERRNITSWDFGDLERVVASSDLAFDVLAYPTLLDTGNSVALRVVTSASVQQRAMRGGVRRLLLLTAAPSRNVVERLLTNAGRLALATADMSIAALADDCIAAAVDHLLDEHLRTGGQLPWAEADFELLRQHVKKASPALARDALVQATAAVAATGAVHSKLAALRAGTLQRSVDDANQHLGRLVRPGFVFNTGITQLPEIERYVRAISARLDGLAGTVERDRRRMDEVVPIEARYSALLDRIPASEMTPAIAALAWELEELRVSVFAQAVGVRGQVSVKRIHTALQRLGG